MADYVKVPDSKSNKEDAERHLRSLVDSMKKRTADASPEKGIHPTAKLQIDTPGMSMAGISVRSAQVNREQGTSDWQNTNEAKDRHKKVIRELISMPKPKLTKSEIEQFDGQLKKAGYWSKRIQQIRTQKETDRQRALKEHFGAQNKPVPQHLAQPQKEGRLDYKKIIREYKTKNNIPQKPETPAVAAPESQPAGYGKLHDPRLSGLAPKVKKAEPKVRVDPVDISDPIVQNRTTVSSPLKISGPASMSPVRDEGLKKCGRVLRHMINSLQKIDPKTKLPGNLINKAK